MTTSEKLKALARTIEQEAEQKAIDALGREVMALLARHGFQPEASSPRPEVKTERRRPPAKKKTVKAKAKPKAPPKPKPQKWSEPPAGTDLGRVLAAIRANPGFRGFELRPKIEANGGPIKEKSLRTSLQRLRERGFTEITGGRWKATTSKAAAHRPGEFVIPPGAH